MPTLSGSVCVVFLADSSFKKSHSRPPHLLWPLPRPQKEWKTWLKLEKVIKRNPGSKTRRPVSFSPLCSAKPRWPVWPWCCLNLLVETSIRRQGISVWRKNCHLFHPLINLSELVCLRVIITCFSLWVFGVVTLCLYQRTEQAQISSLNFSLTFHLLPSGNQMNVGKNNKM